MTQKKPLGPGEARYQVVESKNDDYVKVIVEYRSHSKKAQGVAEALYVSAFNACTRADVAILAEQRKDEIQEGELLTPGGDAVLLRWLTTDDPDVLIPIEGREATEQDRATLDEFGENPLTAQARKDVARAKLSGIEIAHTVGKP